MAQLVIRGHATRGSEVIGLLKMLGGRNLLLQQGCGKGIYLIDTSKHTIIYINENDIIDKFIIFTLEEFLEKFPYKVGDKVIVKGYEQVFEILSMKWCSERNDIMYSVSNGWFYTEELQPYTEQKEENMEEKENSVVVNNEQKQLKVHSLRHDRVQLMIDDKYELKQEGNAYYIVKKQPQYPKTYEECCEVIKIEYPYFKTEEDGISASTYKNKLIGKFKKLLICRDAYWKMAGNWKPDWEPLAMKFIITMSENCLICEEYDGSYNSILAFPTEEVRDAFYENFKGLIEECKELL